MADDQDVVNEGLIVERKIEYNGTSLLVRANSKVIDNIDNKKNMALDANIFISGFGLDARGFDPVLSTGIRRMMPVNTGIKTCMNNFAITLPGFEDVKPGCEAGKANTDGINIESHGEYLIKCIKYFLPKFKIVNVYGFSYGADLCVYKLKEILEHNVSKVVIADPNIANPCDPKNAYFITGRMAACYDEGNHFNDRLQMREYSHNGCKCSMSSVRHGRECQGIKEHKRLFGVSLMIDLGRPDGSRADADRKMLSYLSDVWDKNWDVLGRIAVEVVCDTEDSFYSNKLKIIRDIFKHGTDKKLCNKVLFVFSDHECRNVLSERFNAIIGSSPGAPDINSIDANIEWFGEIEDSKYPKVVVAVGKGHFWLVEPECVRNALALEPLDRADGKTS